MGSARKVSGPSITVMYNKDKQLALNRVSKMRRRHFVWEYLKGKACVDCGEADPIVLQFDHVSGIKILAIAEMVNRGWSIKRIAAELKKCVVRCANCHTRRTAIQRGWFDKKTAFFAS